MNSTYERDDAGVDHDALRSTVGRARRLYSAEMQPAAVAEVTRELHSHLRMLVPICLAMVEQTPKHTLARRRLEAAVDTAQHLMGTSPSGGPMAALVHMQLLADSAAALAARVQAPQT
ncbi:DUF6415 family natural product biosynthesis protein [Streptomyces litchfieldiae]|uniref:DUF6415 family natural product biosynthesis protein n=1 Tax=Streptomyces litchfieldiae TaxID=3075543 RepID=A0ABU2N1C9_9ACTN|nr:DUF6415 family natural product biosynthesis protein [Streptomyces sp. DSM 44938]MDT0347706.1 DUF6415 family natural product biosynthesis protein [Streptomyces sp. DSM 44938]